MSEPDNKALIIYSSRDLTEQADYMSQKEQKVTSGFVGTVFGGTLPRTIVVYW